MTGQPETMQYGFSSIGHPNASLVEMASLAAEFGLDFIELRALGGSIDLSAYFTANYPVEYIPSIRPRVRLIATNLQLIDAAESSINDFLQAVDVAVRLEAPYVRVFGGGHWGEALSRAALDHAVKTVQRCRSAIRERSAACDILLETHSAFSSSIVCLEFNRRLDEPLHILWDSHHTWRNAGESPRESWDQIGPFVRHIHFSDSQSKGLEASHRCVLPGTGEYPVETLRQVLVEEGYAYGVSLEWEKLWHPELPDVRNALEEFRKLFRLTGHNNKLDED